MSLAGSEHQLRVGFMLNKSGGSLLGATNYYHNLLRAVSQSKRIKPVILTAGELPAPIVDGLPPIEVARSSFASISGPLNFVRRAANRIINRDFVMEKILQSNHIDVFSHSGPLGQGCRVATTPWIADFQHTRLPDFFSREERIQRDRYFYRCAKSATLVIVSSEEARKDFAEFLPEFVEKVRVLRFVSVASPNIGDAASIESVERRYHLDGPYFHLPNQFWKHKNHKIVIDALGLARKRGTPLTVVATGHTQDRRHPGHFSMLQGMIRDVGCEHDFRILGIIPYADVTALMKGSIAVINPSFFEGWSTSVEESKSLGKAVILSNIPVHYEQDPSRAYFFDPNDPEQLLDSMLRVRRAYSRDEDVFQQANARQQIRQRWSDFRASFEEIMIEAQSINASRW